MQVGSSVEISIMQTSPETITEAAGFDEGFEREKPAASGDDGVFAPLVLADDERLQKAVSIDRCCQFIDALVGIRLADIAVPGKELFEGNADRVGHDMPLRFE